MLRRITLAALALAAAVTLGAATPIPVISQACGPASATTAAVPPISTMRLGTGRHHAVVIVDTGTAIRRTCVSFDTETITAKQALEMIGAGPVFKEFSGMGSFVCKLYDTGRSVDDCVGDPTYWVYSRAPAGTTSFSPSEVGVSTAVVHDGDVEGWKWATEGAPEYASPEVVCSSAESAAAPMPSGARRPDSPDSSGDGDSTWPTLAGFFGTLALVAAAWVTVRRRRV
jgi:LPXTG-motif cell wall-anchored protein